MRQLLYHWQFANDVYYANSYATYDFSKTNWGKNPPNGIW